MKVRNLLWLFVCFLPIHIQAEIGDESTVNWNDFESAQLKFKEDPKPIFIEFTAKWCGWCKKMDKTTFSEDGVIDILNNQFYAVKIDFDSTTPIEYKGDSYSGKELAKHFGIEGLPTMIYLSSDQETSKTIVGYKTAKQLIKELKKLNAD
ncbi:thioredoxin family protein [Reichenbachiella sp.]|uniref:thioredoxin family protein n=1 Tax=Reichenbachiella sp. TaxID=2184521 RepID=UPI003B5CA155